MFISVLFLFVFSFKISFLYNFLLFKFVFTINISTFLRGLINFCCFNKEPCVQGISGSITVSSCVSSQSDLKVTSSFAYIHTSYYILHISISKPHSYVLMYYKVQITGTGNKSNMMEKQENISVLYDGKLTS